MTELLQAIDIRYLFFPLMGGLGVALIGGPLGAFMVWRRLAYFGDTLAHSGLLGITIALAWKMNLMLGVSIVAIIVASLLLTLQRHIKVSSDTLLGLLSHTVLALGLLLLASMERVRVDVLGFLYGDILAVTLPDVLIIYSGGAGVLLILAFLWQPLLRITLDSDLAQVEGVKVRQVQAAYILLLALVVAIAIKIVGVLLITALLLIPAAAARPLAKSPEQMAMLASLIGMIAVFVGVLISHFWDVPTGPAIVVTSSGVLIFTVILKKLAK